MVQSKPAKSVKLADLRDRFGLRPVEIDDFFEEWLEPLPELTSAAIDRLNQVRRHYLYLLEYPVMEGVVKMVVLSPLLELAGFYDEPFRVRGETEIRVTAQDEGEVIHGNIDILVLQNQMWITVIEAKNSELSLTKAIPQALSYMMADPRIAERSNYGLVMNGSEFLFLKLLRQPDPIYAVSDVFSLLNRGNDLCRVLQVLKKLSAMLEGGRS
jgi:hypothetical protein